MFVASRGLLCLDLDRTELRMNTVSELRKMFSDTPNCKFVTAEVYMQGLTGRRKMVRSDEPGANLLGLLDSSTGRRILVPAEDFDKEMQTQAHAQVMSLDDH